MKNIEIKARCKDFHSLKNIIADNGGEFKETMKQVDTYFNVSKGRLKLREIEGQSSYLIFYEREDTSQAKASNYLIYNTNDPKSLKALLIKISGIKKIVDKTRELYIIKHTRIHLDTVKELGTFIELETVITNQTEEEAFRENESIIKLLQIRKESMLTGSYSDMIT